MWFIQKRTRILLVFEKYYMRASNRASLTVMLTQNEDMIYIDAIGSDGGQGACLVFHRAKKKIL